MKKKSKVITTSTVTITYDGEIIHLINEVSNIGKENVIVPYKYQTKYECAISYANAIQNIIEDKLRVDRTLIITVEYSKR